MKIELKGIVPEAVKITCCKDAGVSFETEEGKHGNLIHIRSNGKVAVNGNEDVTPELVGLALLQWAQTFSRVMNK